RMPGLPYLKLAAVMIVLTVITSYLFLIPDWFGEQGSAEADDIDRLFEVSIVFSAFVFSVVMVMLGYALWRWRARPGDESDGEPIHGNTRLEIAWTLIPTIIVLFAGGYSWKVLDDIEDPAPRNERLTVSVFSQQFAWSFAYPGKDYAWTEEALHVPVDRQIHFKMHALDVIHSFWVPEWRIKKDNVPGITTTAIVTPDKVGTYQLVCTELCGFGHATMRAKVVVEPWPKFKKWVEGLEQKAPKELMESVELDSVTNPPDLGAGGA
ncbi:MAG TPA: cytochrome c oxidase subunit II, partial [Solirubrobacterales bacterium]|nr:cytochrome c oxidase subunit II [Solirubrobacterales bacterium]